MAFFFAPYQIRGRPGRGVRIALDGAGALGLFVLLWTFGHFTFPAVARADTSVFRGGFLLVDVATLLVIAAVVHPRSDLGPILGCTPLRWIGLRSYSLYLWHYPIFCITRPGLDVPLHGWPDLALRLGLSFGAAELSYRYVETPIRGGAIGRYLARLRTERGEIRRRVAPAGRGRRHRVGAHRDGARRRPRERAGRDREHSRREREGARARQGQRRRREDDRPAAHASHAP